jgi:hypothetical protein
MNQLSCDATLQLKVVACISTGKKLEVRSRVGVEPRSGKSGKSQLIYLYEDEIGKIQYALNMQEQEYSNDIQFTGDDLKSRHLQGTASGIGIQEDRG